ncbi:MAG: NAD(P)/FAD-dependent oxidoreductase [Pseudomonadota bacterium]
MTETEAAGIDILHCAREMTGTPSRRPSSGENMQAQIPASPPEGGTQDVMIIGAGLSGVGMACRLKMSCPDTTFTVLESRERIGGTWDLFRYPGVRSDSDMHTLGYPFRPWSNGDAIADGEAIRHYIEETAYEYGVDRYIRFGMTVMAADWSSETRLWALTIKNGDELHIVTCRCLVACAGYYEYDQGYTPDFPGIENFNGEIVHPQYWPEDISLKNRHVVVIGSGATAITLVPALAKLAGHVTMLQRSPTYVVAQDKDSPLARGLRRMTPRRFADSIIRWQSILLSLAQYGFARRLPKRRRGHA